MDIKTEIKQELAPSEVASQSEESFISEDTALKMDNYSTAWNSDYKMDTQMQIKQEAPFPDFPPQKESMQKYIDCRNENLMGPKISMEEGSHYNFCEVVIKEEPQWMGRTSAEGPSGHGEIQDEVNEEESSRLHVADSDKSEDGDGRNNNFISTECTPENNCETQMPSMKEPAYSRQNSMMQQSDVYGHTSAYKPMLVGHRTNVKIGKIHKCTICQKIFSQISHLKQHNLIHSGIKPHKCEVCGKGFIQYSHLKRHNLTHEGERVHKCELCEKSFTHLSYLKQHYLIHQGVKPYKCDSCDKCFMYMSHLRQHHLTHEGVKAFKCDICGRSFTLAPHLKMHRFVHESVKPHKCSICEKSFPSKSHLNRHNAIHLGLTKAKRAKKGSHNTKGSLGAV